MRRWFALFMICLLPIQASWASVANYCVHEQGVAVDHFGHHAEEHQVLAEPDDQDQPSGNLGHSHHHDHLSGFLGLTSALTSMPFLPWPSVSPGEDLIYPSLPPDQPERPNWSLPA